MKSILFVDDDDYMLDFYTLMFERNFKVYVAINDEEAREVLNLVDVDMVVVDFNMPDLDGIRLLNDKVHERIVVTTCDEGRYVRGILGDVEIVDKMKLKEYLLKEDTWKSSGTI